ncbi:MAG: hypothetical protein EP332_04110 [Bacteroidetes bacterium]|nr:MAG: hypothetical protein EP332_04110 [Bacteroidota bacterium]
MNYNIIAYSVYLGVTLALTVFVGRSLFRNGRIFLRDIFHGNLELAESVDKLLLVGYYLINMGYAVYNMQIGTHMENAQEVMEVLSYKLGVIILILGIMHFFNMFVFFKLRNREQLYN